MAVGAHEVVTREEELAAVGRFLDGGTSLPGGARSPPPPDLSVGGGKSAGDPETGEMRR
jgi:hypothetical protein